MKVGDRVKLICTEEAVPVGTLGKIIDIVEDDYWGELFKVEFLGNDIIFLPRKCLKLAS